MQADVFEKICEEIASCSDDNDTICQRHGTTDDSLYRFLAKEETACGKYARAKQLQADVRAERFGKRVSSSSVLDAPKMRVELEYLKWSNAHLAPRKWTDKVDVTSGGDKVSVVFNVPRPVDDAAV